MTADPAGPAGPSPVVRLAPAKLNLTLAVVGSRPDGYHDLHSVMVPLALSDVLSVAVTSGRSDSLYVDGIDCGPAESNLVLLAIAAAREAARRELGPATPLPPLACRLEKRIPVAAGLAGGSSDAAVALDAALDAWGADVSPTGRHAAATRVGSDVPFFLSGGWALVEGRGERVAPLPSCGPPAPAALLVTPATPVSTPDVFAAYAAGVRPLSRGSGLLSSRHLADELRAGMAARALLVRTGSLTRANDLVPATDRVVPGLAAFRRGLVRVLGTAVGQSGSGPTAWVLYPSLDEAKAAADAVRDALADGRVVAPGDGEPAVHATRLIVDPPARPAAPGKGGSTR